MYSYAPSLTTVLDTTVGLAKVVSGQMRVRVALPVELVQNCLADRGVEQIVFGPPGRELLSHARHGVCQPVNRQLGHDS